MSEEAQEAQAPEEAKPEEAAPPAPAVQPEAGASTTVEAPIDVTEPAIAPEVPRLVRPDGTAKAIPETILHPVPSALFLAVVSIVSLVADVGTKLFAEKKLEGTYPGGGQPYVLVKDHLTFVIAHNKGGAWGLLQGESEN